MSSSLLISGINMLKRTWPDAPPRSGLDPKDPGTLWRVENGLVHTAKIEQGFSDGPVLNLEGRLLGINTRTGILSDRNLTFAINAESFRPHLSPPLGSLPAVSAGPVDLEVPAFDDVGDFRSPLTEALWTIEGLDRLALASGLAPERVETLSREVTGALRECNAQGEPVDRDLVAWVWNHYYAARKRELRAEMRERSHRAAVTLRPN